MSDSFAELDKLNFDDKNKWGTPKPEKKEVKPPEKPVEKPKETPPAEKPAQKPEDAPKEEAKTEEAPKGYRSLGRALEEAQTKLRTQSDEIAKLKDEVDKTKAKPVEDTERTAFVEKLTAAEKRVQELEDEIKYVNYAKSTEFVDKYKKPYEEAWQKAVAELSELTVEQEDGSSRQATANDLVVLANMPLGEARKLAKTMFGDAADDVMTHRRAIRELSDAQTKALESARTNSTEREKQLAVQQAQMREAATKAWQASNQSLEEKYPNWFGHPDTDPEGNELFDKSREQIDRFLFMQTEKLAPEAMVKFHALVRAKFANHDRLAMHNKKLREENATLKKTIEDYEKSEPPAGSTSKSASATPKSFMESVEDELRELDKKA